MFFRLVKNKYALEETHAKERGHEVAIFTVHRALIEGTVMVLAASAMGFLDSRRIRNGGLID